MDFASPRRGFVTWRAQTQTESFRVENLHSKESHLAHSERESDERVQKFAPLLIGLRFWVARTRCRREGGLQKCIFQGRTREMQEEMPRVRHALEYLFMAVWIFMILWYEPFQTSLTPHNYSYRNHPAKLPQTKLHFFEVDGSKHFSFVKICIFGFIRFHKS